MTLPWRDLLFRLLVCLPFWVGLLWPRAGLAGVCVCGWEWVGVGGGGWVWVGGWVGGVGGVGGVGEVGGGEEGGVRVPAGLRRWLESRFLHVSMF